MIYEEQSWEFIILEMYVVFVLYFCNDYYLIYDFGIILELQVLYYKLNCWLINFLYLLYIYYFEYIEFMREGISLKLVLNVFIIYMKKVK